MVPHRIDEHAHARAVARRDHAGELVARAALGDELVGDLLVVRPPGVAGDVLGGGGDLNISVTCAGELVIMFWYLKRKVKWKVELEDALKRIGCREGNSGWATATDGSGSGSKT